MKFNKLILIILIVFLKTGNVLSEDTIFNVNNIKLIKKSQLTNGDQAGQAIKKGFEELIKKILLEEDIKKLLQLELSQIRELVLYYQMINETDENENSDMVTYNISFDKDKLHNLFYKKRISYSEISDKELFLLPILKKDNQIFVYNQNFFYDKWNEIYNNELVEFILPLENIEIIQKVNLNKNNLLELELSNLLEEYSSKNLAVVLIEDDNLNVVLVEGSVQIKNIVTNKSTKLSPGFMGSVSKKTNLISKTKVNTKLYRKKTRNRKYL